MFLCNNPVYSIGMQIILVHIELMMFCPLVVSTLGEGVGY